MALVIPNKPSTTPPEIPHNATTNVLGAGGRNGAAKLYGEDPEVIRVDELANPGDHSLEDVNAFNKRTNVPVTEEKGIDNEELKNPPHISITAADWVKAPKGNPDWKPRQLKEVARTDDRRESVIVPTEHQYANDPIDDEG